MHGVDLLSADDILQRCERVLAASPADSTSLTWLEVGRAEVAVGGRRDDEAPQPVRERTVQVRVEERGRVGFHRTGADGVGELENAVRSALAQAASNPPPEVAAGVPARAAGGEAAAAPPGSFDDALARLAPAEATRLLESGLQGGERARLAWAEAHVVVASSGGQRRRAEVTTATFTVRSGRGGGAGRAAGSARSLAALDAEAIRDRARARRTDDVVEPGELETLLAGGPPAVVLGPEAVAALLDLLNRHALSPRTIRDGSSALAGAGGQRLFDPALTLRDDGADPTGLPFPFDLAGGVRRPMELVTAGVVSAAAVQAAGARCADDGRLENLFLVPGALDDGELLAAVTAAAGGGDGLWIDGLDRVGCFDPPTLRFRARARGVRTIVAGAFGPALGDLIWEDSLLRLFASVAGVGGEPIVLATGDGYLGGTSTPALVCPSAAGLRPAG